jgi:hypothetical protein
LTPVGGVEVVDHVSVGGASDVRHHGMAGKTGVFGNILPPRIGAIDSV